MIGRDVGGAGAGVVGSTGGSALALAAAAADPPVGGFEECLGTVGAARR